MFERPHNEDSPTHFSFALVADLHLTEEQGLEHLGRFADAIRARPDVAFVVALGDIMWDGPMAELKRLLSRAEKPVHVLYGNADVGRLAEYEAAFGARDRTWQYGGCLFAALWNCLPPDAPDNHRGDCTEAQWRWLAAQFEAARAGGARHLFLVSHVPPACPAGYHRDLYLRRDAEERFWQVCRRFRVDACFFAHLHQDITFRRGQTQIIVTPSLNWDFLPPADGKVPADTWCRQVDSGHFRVVRVDAGGIEHALLPI